MWFLWEDWGRDYFYFSSIIFILIKDNTRHSYQLLIEFPRTSFKQKFQLSASLGNRSAYAIGIGVELKLIIP